MTKPIKVRTPKGLRLIGPGNTVFIVAEMSGNHNKSFKKALQLIDAAARAGADAIKIQTYTPDTMTIDSDKEYFIVNSRNKWAGQTLYKLYNDSYTPWEWQSDLKKYAESKGLFFFSTPFDNTAVDFLEKLELQLYKIASFEVTDIPLLEKIGKTKKPVIISRGMATRKEISDAVKTLRENGSSNIAVLHCITSYPANSKNMNLSTIINLHKKFGISGLSDHSLENMPSLTAVALGASIIEKHLTIKRSEGGSDAEFSLEESEFKNLVSSIRKIELAIGEPKYGTTTKEEKNFSIYRRSIFVAINIKQGERFTDRNIRVIRPGHGLPPKYYSKILGKISKVDIKMGTPLDWEFIDEKIKNQKTL